MHMGVAPDGRFTGKAWVTFANPVEFLEAVTGLNKEVSPQEAILASVFIDIAEPERENFNLDSTHQASQVRNKERNTGEHREPQADVEQQGWETPPHKPGTPED